MNKKNIILVLFLSIMASCAQEGPYVAGKVKCDFSVAVSSSMAVVSATLPKNDNLLKEIEYSDLFLTEKKVDGTNSIGSGDRIYGEFYSDEYDEYHIHKFFRELKPNTTYYPIVKVNSTINSPDEYSNFFYNSGFSFKTTQSNPKDPNDPNADYMSILNSILKTTTCEVTLYAFGYARIKISLPNDIELSSSTQLRVSTSPDMKDYKSYKVVSTSGLDSQGYANIEISEDKIYYFEIISKLYLGGKYHSLMPDWDNSKEVTIRIEKPINSAELQQEALTSDVTCSLLDYRAKILKDNSSPDSYEYFTVVRINMPSNVRILNYDTPHFFSLYCDMFISLQAFSISDSDNVEKAWFNDNYLYPYNNLSNYDCKPNEYVFVFPMLKKDKYILKLNCCVDISLGSNSKYDSIIDDIMIKVDNMLDLTNVSDN